MITIRDFADVTTSKQYSDGMLNNDEVYSGIPESSYSQFIISTNNLPALIRDKKVDKYQEFYEKFYK